MNKIKSKYSYIQNWADFFNINIIDLYSYEFEDIRINFSLKEPLLPQRDILWDFGLNDYIKIIDISSNTEISKFDYKFLFQIYRKFDKTDDILLKGKYSEKLIVTVLMKIMALYPSIKKEYRIRIKKEKDFHNCLNHNYFDFTNLKSENFCIKKFKIYKLYWRSEKCISRVGRDNKFEIMEITEWFLKYDQTILSSNYIKKLLPKKIVKEWSDYAYSSTHAGNKKEFNLDKKITADFKEKLKLDEFVLSFKMQD